jgi:hypothetical protein
MGSAMIASATSTKVRASADLPGSNLVTKKVPTTMSAPSGSASAPSASSILACGRLANATSRR